ncbi:MAG: GxxExxY protein [Sedimenticolaceae bacterium]
MDREVVARELVDSALKVHSTLGPGLLESAYEACMAYELVERGIAVTRQKLLPIRYGEARIDAAYRLDLLVDDQIVVELKTVSSLLPVREAQLLSYLKLGDFHLGFLLNFNVRRMKEGIRRMLNGFQP